MDPQDLITGRQMFVVNYIRQMSELGDRLNRLIKNDNIVNRVFSRFVQGDDIDIESKVCFARFNTAKRILRSPELLYDVELINNFLDICPPEWNAFLITEFEFYSPQEWRYFDVLKDFKEWAFNELLLTTAYETFCREIRSISTRLIRLLHEVYFSINRPLNGMN